MNPSSSYSDVVDIDKINALGAAEAHEALKRCNGSERWTRLMMAKRPFGSAEEMFEHARSIWSELSHEDWMEGFSHHPRIGDLDKLREKFSASNTWSEKEQAGVAIAPDSVLQELKENNDLYLSRFGYIFIVCASGKSAAEMLQLLKDRLDNPPAEELKIALEEHAKITKLRLEKLCR